MKEKQKSKKKKVIITLIVILVVIAGIFIAGYIAVNKAFSMLTESLYETTPETVQQQEQKEVELSENKGAETMPPQESTVPSGESNAATQKKDSTPPAKKDALTKTQEKYGIEGSMNFSPESIKKFEKSVSLVDKLSMMAIISGSLSKSDFQKVLALTSGGVSREEINQALVILQNGLTGKEKSEIYKYFKKYEHLLGE